MRNEFTAIVEQDGPWYRYCAEVPCTNGQGKSRGECLANLREAIALILEHRREESLRALPPDAQKELVVIGKSEKNSSGISAATVAYGDSKPLSEENLSQALELTRLGKRRSWYGVAASAKEAGKCQNETRPFVFFVLGRVSGNGAEI